MHKMEAVKCGTGKEGDYCLQKDANLGISQSLWDGVSQNVEDVSYVFDETTPVKACGDMAHHVADNVDVNKELEHCGMMSSQLKRRRMLQFDNEEREDSLKDSSSDMSQWVSIFSEDTSALGYEGLDQSSEGWLADCFLDAEMHCSPDDMNLSGAPDVNIDISEFCNTPPEHEATAAQKHPTRTRQNVVVRDVTLKDINQRIFTPPTSKSKQRKEDPSASFPTSAFSGKPVVGRTKIHTEGGKGSITIMRTKG
ncbi:x-ray induced transcript 1 [Actinidia rufa]|uniref:X-ray induced transcript 1 n=1 Tax=Actinidia rufa TaxID=165716 RepID=A0A7J0H7S0_9ERIC|nr:x-ray induced transcript 1 [Actinidia rufa]